MIFSTKPDSAHLVLVCSFATRLHIYSKRVTFNLKLAYLLYNLSLSCETQGNLSISQKKYSCIFNVRPLFHLFSAVSDCGESHLFIYLLKRDATGYLMRESSFICPVSEGHFVISADYNKLPLQSFNVTAYLWATLVTPHYATQWHFKKRVRGRDSNEFSLGKLKCLPEKLHNCWANHCG